MKKSIIRKNKNLFFFLTATLFVVDQITKFIAAKMGEAGILSVVQNKGVAFGINVPIAVPVVLSVAAVFVIAYYYKDIIRKKALSVFSALILGGALGNLVDRLAFGFVRDFINLKIWPAFNLADAGLTIGIIGLIIYIGLKKD